MSERKFIILAIFTIFCSMVIFCSDTIIIEKKHKKFYKRGDIADLDQILELSQYEGGVLQELAIHYNMIRSDLEIQWLINGGIISQNILEKGTRKKISYLFQKHIDQHSSFQVRFVGPKGMIQLTKISATVEIKQTEEQEQNQGEHKPINISSKKINNVYDKMFDTVSNFQVVSETLNQLVFTIDYQFYSHDNRGDVSIAMRLDNKLLPPSFSYTQTIKDNPSNILRENGCGSIRFEVIYNPDKPDSCNTNSIVVGIYQVNDDQRKWFLKQSFEYKKSWSTIALKTQAKPPFIAETAKSEDTEQQKKQGTGLFIQPKLETAPLITDIPILIPPFDRYGFDDLKKTSYNKTPILLVIEPRKPQPTAEDRVGASSPGSLADALKGGLGELGDCFSETTDEMSSALAKSSASEVLKGAMKGIWGNLGKVIDKTNALINGDSDVARFIRGERRVVPWAFIFFVRTNEGNYAKLLAKVDDDTDDLVILDYVLYDHNGQIMEKALLKQPIYRTYLFDVEHEILGPFASPESADLHWRWMLVPNSTRVGGYLTPINNAGICLVGMQQVITY